jgi:hypothetical protein
MSENNKPVEMSAAELDEVAGGAFNIVDASNLNFSDEQVSVTALGANGGITNATAQKTKLSEQDLVQVQATGDFPGFPTGIFPSK